MTTLSTTNAYLPRSISRRKSAASLNPDVKALAFLARNGAPLNFIRAVVALAYEYAGGVTSDVIRAAQPGNAGHHSEAKRIRAFMYTRLIEAGYHMGYLTKYFNTSKHTVQEMRKFYKQSEGKKA